MKTMLSVEKLSILDEADVPLVRDVSFSVPEGEAFFLVGETGCGKTLIGQAVAGTLAKRLSSRGAVFFEGADVLKMSGEDREKLWGRSLCLLPQEPFSALNPLLSVFRQVREVFEKVRGMKRKESEREAGRLFSFLGISSEASAERPGKLSGGMAQRALLAAVLASPARFILLDEPTKGLDSASKEDAMILVRKILRSGRTLLCITHDLSLPLKTGGWTGVLFGGMMAESGPSREILERPSHPYTRGLLNALPERGLHPIPDELLKGLEKAWAV